MWFNCFCYESSPQQAVGYPDKIKLEFLEKILRKNVINRKGKKSTDIFPNFTYYVAFDAELSFYKATSAMRILYSKSNQHDINTAIKRGWSEEIRDYLKWSSDGNKWGLFHECLDLSGKNWSEEISGIVAFFKYDKKPNVFPNPFAKNKRQYLNYQWLGENPNK